MIQLEQLADGSVSDRNFQKLMALVPDSGGQTVGFRFGVDTLTWAGGSPFTSTRTVAHGLGRVPLVAFSTATLAGGSAPCVVHIVSFDATSVLLRGYAADDSSPAGATTKTVYWAVCG